MHSVHFAAESESGDHLVGIVLDDDLADLLDGLLVRIVARTREVKRRRTARCAVGSSEVDSHTEVQLQASLDVVDDVVLD